MASRIEQLKKIVAMDPASEIGHFGLGSAFFSEKRYEEAALSFQKVIEIKPDYTAAYLLLGKSLEKLGRKEEAKNTYRKGIVVGERTGDVMPKNEMEHRLMRLEWKPPDSPSS